MSLLRLATISGVIIAAIASAAQAQSAYVWNAPNYRAYYPQYYAGSPYRHSGWYGGADSASGSMYATAIQPQRIHSFGVPPYELVGGYWPVATTARQPVGHMIVPTGPNGYYYRPIYDPYEGAILGGQLVRPWTADLADPPAPLMIRPTPPAEIVQPYAESVPHGDAVRPVPQSHPQGRRAF